jgi:hypothetical protein
MRVLLLAAFLFGSLPAHSQVFRLSEVAEVASDETERMTLKGDDWEEELFVIKRAVVTEDDVAKAFPLSQGGEWSISIELDEEGGAKMKAATGKMTAGKDRVAILVDGELLIAPIVMSTPLGARLAIPAGKDMDAAEVQDLARRISGLPPLEPGEAPLNPPRVIDYEPYTEEEYLERKANREKVGIFYVEWIPSEKELDRQLKLGMTQDEVIELFGKPTMGSVQDGEPHSRLSYRLAPEKIADNPERKMLPVSIEVEFTDGKVTDWSHSWSTASRELKVKGPAPEPGILTMILPDMDMSDEDADFTDYFEAVIVPDPNQKVNETDLNQLASLGYMMKNAIASSDGDKPTVSANCDLMREMVRHFPELRKLREEAVKGRVDVEEMSKALEPYVFGEKAGPIPKE